MSELDYAKMRESLDMLERELMERTGIKSLPLGKPADPFDKVLQAAAVFKTNIDNAATVSECLLVSRSIGPLILLLESLERDALNKADTL